MRNNREYHKEYSKKWRQNNPNKAREYNRKHLKKLREEKLSKINIISLEGECFKQYENKLISNFGRVFNKWGQQICVGVAKGNGYHSINGIIIARIIYALFKGPISEGLVINHIDGNKLNDHIDNLEVVTYKENNEHALRLGLRKRYKKFSDADICNVLQMIEDGMSNFDIANITSISRSYISSIRNGRWRKDICESYKQNAK